MQNTLHRENGYLVERDPNGKPIRAIRIATVVYVARDDESRYADSPPTFRKRTTIHTAGGSYPTVSVDFETVFALLTSCNTENA